MNVTDDVLDDLLAVVSAGEVSADTLRLVEHRAAQDPRFRVRLDAARSAASSGPDFARAVPAPEVELRSLSRTRAFFRIRMILLAGAIAFSLLPFAVTGGSEGVRFLVWPEVGLRWALLSLAAASWVAWAVVGRQVGRAGL